MSTVTFETIDSLKQRDSQCTNQPPPASALKNLLERSLNKMYQKNKCQGMRQGTWNVQLQSLLTKTKTISIKSNNVIKNSLRPLSN